MQTFAHFREIIARVVHEMMQQIYTTVTDRLSIAQRKCALLARHRAHLISTTLLIRSSSLDPVGT